MSIQDGNPVNAAYTNTKLASKTGDNSLAGKQTLARALSGDTITDAQKTLNDLLDVVGFVDENDPAPKDYSSNNVVADGDDRKVAIEKLDGEFDESTGHSHSGAPGDGAPISAGALTSFNKYFESFLSFTYATASGTSVNITSNMSGKSPNGSSSSVGVLTGAPDNQTFIVDSVSGDPIEDTNGAQIYGRITYASGVWTLSFYSLVAGVETAYSLPSTNILVLYREIFDQATRPTISSHPALAAKVDVTSTIPDASPSVAGKVSTGTQSFAGDKTFEGSLTTESLLNGDIEIDSTTSGTGTQSEPVTKLFHKYTSNTLVSIASFPSMTTDTLIVITNDTGNAFDLIYSNVGAGDIITPDGTDMTIEDGASVLLYYDTDSNRVRVIGGLGGPTISTPVSLANGGTNKSLVASAGAVTYSDSDSLELTSVGASGQVLKSNGSSAPNFQWADMVTASASTTYAILSTDEVIKVNASGGSFTVTLPTAVGNNGKKFTIKRMDQTLANAVTIATTSSQTIDGATTRKLMTQYEEFTVVSDNSNWVITSHTYPKAWVSFTGAGSWSTNTTYTCLWRRDADSAEIQYSVNTTGAPNATSLTLDVMPGVTIDTTKNATNDFAMPLGLGGTIVNDSSSTGYDGPVGYASTTSVRPYVRQSGNPTRITPIDNTTPIIFGSGDYVNVRFKVPITNWEG